MRNRLEFRVVTSTVKPLMFSLGSDTSVITYKIDKSWKRIDIQRSSIKAHLEIPYAVYFFKPSSGVK